jgi:deoxyribonuclease-4
MSYSALKQELIRSSALKIPYCVLHPGAHMGSGINAGLLKLSESLNRILSETADTTSRLLLETTAGQGSGLGHKFEQLSEIMTRIDLKERVGICLDTCHIFAAGYDLRTPETYRQTMNHFDAVLGLDQLFAIHVNDSKKDLGSRVDRHTHIGKGALGVNAFEHLLNDERLLHIPKLLETAHTEGDMDWTTRNLDLMRSLVSSQTRSHKP